MTQSLSSPGLAPEHECASARHFGRRARGVVPVSTGAAVLGVFGGILGLGAIGAAVIGGGPFERSQVQGLSAAGAVGIDFDGDGISDLQEQILGTRIDLTDSDLDGYSDLLELARQTNPLDPASIPGDSSERVGMAGFAYESTVTILTAIYVPAGGLTSASVNFGIVLGGTATPIDTNSVLGSSSVQFGPTSANGDAILVIESQVPESLLHAYNGSAFYATVAQPGLFTSAAAFQTLSFPGTDANGDPLPMLVRPENPPPGVGSSGGALGLPNSSSGGQNVDVGTVFRPLSADEDIPSDWSTGQICYQEMHAVGVNGLNVVYQVDYASCEEFDTYCSPSSCSASVGQGVEIVDPGAIVGG